MKNIGIITPSKRLFDLYVKENPQEGAYFTHIYSIDQIRGRFFSEIIKGYNYHLINSDVYEAAILRIK